ncbi:FYVE finger containing protein [Phytophthora cinnamomi]|uniref:FYVE finger containing protein n=1 Tax=Phytophthora cinnamomi TaxID=4785 RepID=UPI003559612A|nr:FYVE finger containing protein [Phytophthora cinnamomi]
MPRRTSPSVPRTASVTSTTSTYRPGKLQFPLPDDYFPPVSLSLTEVQQYEEQVEKMVTKAMASCLDHEARVAGFGLEDERRWQEIARDEDLSIVRRKQGSNIITRTFGTVTGDFRRFVDFFSSDTSEQLFAWNQFFFGCAVDAVVLCKLDLDKSEKQASLGIKWTCMQPSVLTRKRDECFLEYIIFKKDDQGRDAAVIVRKPVDIPECPPLPHELKTKREKVTTVMVVRASDMHPNATQLFMVTECENKGLTASTKYCKKLLKALKDVSLSADAKRISTTISTPGFVEQSRRGEPQVFGDNIKPWVPTGIRNSCTSCTRPFRAGHRRRHCQLCGDVFCSKCLVRRAGIRQEKNAITNYIAMANQRTFRVAQTLYCKVCVTRSREEDAEALQEQTEGARRSLASSKSSSVPHRSSMGSSTQPRNSRCSTPTSSAQRSSLAQQPDVARRNATWIEENRSSWWSENDSETGSWKSGSGRFSNISRNYSGAPTVRSSLSSDYSHGRNSFMAVQSLQTPREVDNEQGDDRIDERRSSIYEVIDTKDMLSESELRRRKHSSVSASSDDMSDEDFFNELTDSARARYTSTPIAPTYLPPRSTSRRTRSTDQGENTSSARSLDQCIAEQNELLQQVLTASRAYNADPHARAQASSFNSTSSISEDDDDDSHDDGVYEL